MYFQFVKIRWCDKQIYSTPTTLLITAKDNAVESAKNKFEECLYEDVKHSWYQEFVFRLG